MGVHFEIKPVKLITSMIFKDQKNMLAAERLMIEAYGPLEPGFEKILPFDYTDYYCEEFGSPLTRKFLCFKHRVPLEGISSIKIKTNSMEDELRVDGKRMVNIDPGYVTEAKLVLLTTKDYVHRVHIGKHMFAESTLHFEGKTFRPWPWTYPDYASKELVEYFNMVREKYVQDLKDSR